MWFQQKEKNNTYFIEDGQTLKVTYGLHQNYSVGQIVLLDIAMVVYRGYEIISKEEKQNELGGIDLIFTVKFSFLPETNQK